jgi:hypothetical protein
VTSNINYASINENFPVAGRDNDTQTFRDNFDTIKTSLRYAYEEVTDLQDNVVRADQSNDFNNNVITGAVFQNNRDAVFDGQNIVVPISIDYSNGNYQIFRFGASITLGFLSFPGDLTSPIGVGKVMLEIYGDGTSRTITLDPSSGIVYKKRNWPVSPGGNAFTVSSTTNPTLLEIWRYSDGTVFVNYIGEFS